MSPLELVNLTTLMLQTSGNSDLRIGLIDGPVDVHHPDLAHESLREITTKKGATCGRVESSACVHGTFVAGILSARRGSAAPAICPGCTLIIRPIFAEVSSADREMPAAAPIDLAEAIIDCVDTGARVINLSLGLARPSVRTERILDEVLDQAMRRGTIIVAAAGNQGLLGSSTITRNPWVIPVTACDYRGRPTNASNLGASIGCNGLAAPGDSITSIGADRQPVTLGGTSAAVPFVAGAIALLWSEFPAATAMQVKAAVLRATAGSRVSVVPPLLDAAAAFRSLSSSSVRRLVA